LLGALAAEIGPDLAEIGRLWPTLPAGVKAALLSFAKAAAGKP
jgi:hypothetical protein